MRPPSWLAAAVVLSSACGGLRVADQTLTGDYAWPNGAPRVRLERVILLASDRSGPGRVLGWLGGRKENGPFLRPYGIAWDGDDLLLTDPDAGRVARIGPGGRIALSPEGTVTSPIGVARCAQGVVVSDAVAGKVALLGHDLKRARWLVDGLERPTGVACTGERVFVLETGKHRLLALGADGSRREIGDRGDGPGRFNFPTALAAANGSLWIGDTMNFRVQRLDLPSEGFLEGFGRIGDAAGEMPRIKGIAADSDGRLWVSDAHLDQVSLYSAEGLFLMALGRTGAEPGQFSFPAGVAARADGRIAVVDSLNRRVQVFRLLPRAAEP